MCSLIFVASIYWTVRFAAAGFIPTTPAEIKELGWAVSLVQIPGALLLFMAISFSVPAIVNIVEFLGKLGEEQKD